MNSPKLFGKHCCFSFLRDQIKVHDNSMNSVATVLNRFLPLSSWVVSAVSSVIHSAFFFKPLPLAFSSSKLTIENARTRCIIRSNLTIKTPDVFIVNFEHVIAGWVLFYRHENTKN